MRCHLNQLVSAPFTFFRLSKFEFRLLTSVCEARQWSRMDNYGEWIKLRSSFKPFVVKVHELLRRCRRPLVHVGRMNTTGDMTRQFCLVSTQFRWVLSRLEQVSNLQLSSLKYIEDYWKLNWKLETGSRQDKTVFLQLCSHRRHGQDKTLEDSLVLSMSGVWSIKFGNRFDCQ